MRAKTFGIIVWWYFLVLLLVGCSSPPTVEGDETYLHINFDGTVTYEFKIDCDMVENGFCMGSRKRVTPEHPSVR